MACDQANSCRSSRDSSALPFAASILAARKFRYASRVKSTRRGAKKMENSFQAVAGGGGKAANTESRSIAPQNVACGCITFIPFGLMLRA